MRTRTAHGPGTQTQGRGLLVPVCSLLCIARAPSEAELALVRVSRFQQVRTLAASRQLSCQLGWWPAERWPSWRCAPHHAHWRRATSAQRATNGAADVAAKGRASGGYYAGFDTTFVSTDCSSFCMEAISLSIFESETANSVALHQSCRRLGLSFIEMTDPRSSPTNSTGSCSLNCTCTQIIVQRANGGACRHDAARPCCDASHQQLPVHHPQGQPW